jgi:crotonobetainyl-CoA:carnitine CoA-transferase CaiB-like acyl-CoA transferase
VGGGGLMTGPGPSNGQRVVLTVEQGLALAYATMRFARLGWRVIRVEPPEGARGAGCFGVEVGKESIVLDLADPAGRETLYSVIERLGVDVFCCDYPDAAALGIAPDRLAAIFPGLIWAGLIDDGLGQSEPLLQAAAGAMELTGPADGPPLMTGIPLIALKAGDEVFGGVCRALAERAMAERAMGAGGQTVLVSMLRAAASWLITTLPLLDFDCAPAEVGRCGNEHRKFVPTNAYPTTDGFMFLAIGNDAQWRRLTELPRFAPAANERRRTNEGRMEQRQSIHVDLAAITRTYSLAELDADLTAATIPHAPINSVAEVAMLPELRDQMAGTEMADGRTVRLPPPALAGDEIVSRLSAPPERGRDTAAVLAEVAAR